MKTAKELREIALGAEPGIKLAESMNLVCSSIATDTGQTYYEYIVDNYIYESKSIDFAISEMVAIGFSVEVLKGKKIGHFTTLLIKW